VDTGQVRAATSSLANSIQKQELLIVGPVKTEYGESFYAGESVTFEGNVCLFISEKLSGKRFKSSILLSSPVKSLILNLGPLKIGLYLRLAAFFFCFSSKLQISIVNLQKDCHPISN